MAFVLPDSKHPLLVVGLTGRVGAGVSFVRDKLRQQLQTFAYRVVNVDVSKSFLVDAFDQSGEPCPPGGASVNPEEKFDEQFPAPKDRIKELQRRGNRMRSTYGDDIIARLCVDLVLDDAEKNHVERTAFLIDSLKRPEEVELLRHVFGGAFVAVAVMSSDAKRKERMGQRKGMAEKDFDGLSEVDANERVPNGQNASDAILRADYFLANDYSTKDELGNEAGRLLRLLFNVGIVSPTIDEFGMHVAYESAARSACLSRQVGAAIFARDGRILSTGCNDVPKFDGGLYPSATDDKRCWTLSGKCYNDEEKRLILDQIMDILGGVIDFDRDIPSKDVPDETEDEGSSVKERIRRRLAGSRIRSLIEFSRAVHAEMDAILALARGAESGIVGSTLYCTTYPCHNCAKHIIAAGIKRVVYLEPYEKSLARKLHFDAISDPLATPGANKNLVELDAYNGVSPLRYNDFFGMKTDRKDRQGVFIDNDRRRENLLHLGAQRPEGLMDRMREASTETSKDSRRDTDEPNVAGTGQGECQTGTGTEDRASGGAVSSGDEVSPANC